MIWFADFETVTINTNYFRKFQDTCVWLYHFRDMNAHNKKYGLTIQEFVYDIFKNANDGDVVYFHNLSWDGDFLFKYLAQIIPVVNDIDNRLKEYVYCFRRGKKYYSLSVKYKNKFIKFKCSYLLLLASIRDLATSNLKKLNDESNHAFYDVEPFKNFNDVPQKYIDYIDNDVEIARVAFITFQNVLKSIDDTIDVTKHLTLGSITRQIMRNQNKHDSIIINENDYNIASYTFRGGLTQFNPRYLNKIRKTNDLTIIDVNSAYPHFLRHDLPYATQKEPNNNADCVYKIKVSGKIKKEFDGIVVFPQDDEFGIERYTKNIKDREFYCFNFELNALKKIYDLNIEIIDTWYLKFDNFLNTYITTLFDYKNKYKKEKNAEFTKIIKILMNSVYGSLCLASEYQSFMYLKQKQDILKLEKYDKKSKTKYDRLFTFFGESETYDVADYKCLRYLELNEQNILTNKLAASYVTAKQRTKLIEILTKLSNPNKQFIYCDTDSLFLHKLNENDETYINSLISEQLGDWSVENFGDRSGHFKVLGPKKYCIKMREFEKNKFAGVNRKDFNIRNYKYGDIVTNASMQTKYTKSGIVLYFVDKIFKKPTI